MRHFNILDFDQTLFNTREALVRVYKRTFSECGLDISIEDLILNEGKSIDLIFDKYDVNDRNRIFIKKLKKELYKDYFKYIIPNYDLLKLNNKIIVSNAHSDDICGILNYYHIMDVLEIFGRDKTDAMKPSPDPFVMVMMAHGIENSYTIYDDQIMGLEAAQKAAHILGNEQMVTLKQVTLSSKDCLGGSGTHVRVQNNVVDKIANNNNAIMTLNQFGILTPKVFFLNHEKIIMEYIDGDLLYKIYRNDYHLKKLISTIDKIKGIDRCNKADFSTYITGVFKHKYSFFEDIAIQKLFSRTILLLERKFHFFNENKSYCHGDFTLNNIIIKDDEFYIIDPNNDSPMYQSWLLDLSKVLQSCRNYEYIMGMTSVNNIVEMNKLRNSIKTLYSDIYGEILLLELTHWLRMLKYKFKINIEHFKLALKICYDIDRELDVYYGRD